MINLWDGIKIDEDSTKEQILKQLEPNFILEDEENFVFIHKIGNLRNICIEFTSFSNDSSVGMIKETRDKNGLNSNKVLFVLDLGEYVEEFDEYGETEQPDEGYCCNDINCNDTCCNDRKEKCKDCGNSEHHHYVSVE